MIKKLLVIPFSILAILSFSQSSRIASLSIGDKVPEFLWKQLNNFKSPKHNIDSLKGKLLILDFWNTYCSTCMAYFPKMEKLQNQFNDKLEVILVNSLEDDNAINARLTQINKTRASVGSTLIKVPKLTSLTGDSIASKLFPHKSEPHHVWISSEGKVLAITNSSYATSENVKQVLDGKRVNFNYKDDFFEYSIGKDGFLKPTLPTLLPAFYSAFMPFYQLTDASSGVFRDSVKGSVKMFRANNTIYSLYHEAFRNSEGSPRIIFEVKNWGAYEYPGIDSANDSWRNKNLFSYELYVPEKDADKMSGYMQDDLNRFFGGMFGIEGKLEKRKIKCNVLIKTVEGLLKSIGEKRKYQNTGGSRIYINYPFRSIAQSLTSFLENMSLPVAFVDETGFKGNVDIEFKGDMRNLQNARKQLQQYGLDIIESEREIEVLVIRNKP